MLKKTEMAALHFSSQTFIRGASICYNYQISDHKSVNALKFLVHVGAEFIEFFNWQIVVLIDCRSDGDENCETDQQGPHIVAFSSSVL